MNRTLLTAATLIVGLVGLPPLARAAIVVNDSFPVNIVVFVPCAAGGAGEVVNLSGPLHELMEITVDNNGGFHMKVHF
jgi:hypothetical protein